MAIDPDGNVSQLCKTLTLQENPSPDDCHFAEKAWKESGYKKEHEHMKIAVKSFLNTGSFSPNGGILGALFTADFSLLKHIYYSAKYEKSKTDSTGKNKTNSTWEPLNLDGKKLDYDPNKYWYYDSEKGTFYQK